MSAERASPLRDEGAWKVLTRAVTQCAWSPDDVYLAVALEDPDDAGRSALCVLEAESGRVVMYVAGRTLHGLGWASPEHLLVTRAQDLGTRAILHAVPDGAVLGSVGLPSLPGGRHRVAFSAAHGGVSAVAAVSPWRWHGGASQRVRHRAAYVLRVEPFGVAREVLPTIWRALPTLPHVRPMVCTLEPDGDGLTFWLGEPDAGGAVGANVGHLLRYRWEDDRAAVLCRAGRSVVEVIRADPTRVLLREAHGDDIDARGDLRVVDTDRAVTMVATDDAPDALGPWATVDLHPDRERALVAGRVARARKWQGTLRAFDLAAGLATAAPTEVATAAQRVMGAVWQGDGDGLWVLTARGADGATARPWASLRGGPEEGADGHTLTLEGKKPAQARLAWSPLRTRLTASWRVVPDRADAVARALGAERLAWLPRPGW
jgi:hypothetical protein